MTTLNERILEALGQGPAKVRCRVQLQKLRLKGMVVCHHDGHDFHNTKPVWSVF